MFRELAARGTRDIVVEVGPEAGRRLTSVLAAADPDADAAAWMRRYPFSLAFYNLRQEFAFLRDARAAAGPGLRVIGTGQELMGASRMLLESIGTPDTALPGLLAQEREAYEKAVATGNPLDLFMLTGPADALTGLRDRLTTARRDADASLVASLLDSREIYALNARSGFESNLTRAALMKKYYVAQLPPDRRAAPPPALFKFGAFHVMKGLNTALAEQGWSLFDFREMRRWAHRQTGLDPRLLRLIFGFDLAILIPEGTPSDEIPWRDSSTPGNSRSTSVARDRVAGSKPVAFS